MPEEALNLWQGLLIFTASGNSTAISFLSYFNFAVLVPATCLMREVALGAPAGGPVNTERLRRLGVNEGASIHNVGQSARACPTSLPCLISLEI